MSVGVPIAVANHESLLYALDPVRFARECLEFDPDPHQARILESNANRAILNCSRQWGKSTVCAVKVLHRALYKPSTLVVIACDAQRQSAEILEKATDFLIRLGMKPRTDGKNRHSLKLENRSRIIALPGKFEGKIRGFSALSLLIIDEAAQVSDRLYLALRPMLAVSGGDLWLASTPYGKQGFFYNEWVHGGDRWTRFTVPATECPRIPQSFLDEELEACGQQYFDQEYLCKFHATYDAVFDEETILRAVSPDIQPLLPDGY